MKEDFVWSLERQALLARCPRAYFHLRHDDDSTARQLANLQTLEDWAGRMIRKSLAQALSSNPFPDKDALRQLALRNMRESWLEYLNGAWREQPENATNIFELYYGNGEEYGTLRKLPKELTDNAKQRILDAMDAFHYSPFIRSLAALGRSVWSFPGRGDSFRIDEISVHETPDFIYMDGTMNALFWTLGNEHRPFLRLRQACCKLYAMEKFSMPASQVNVCTVFLNDGGRGRSFFVSEADLNSARQQILRSAKAMLAKEEACHAKEDYPMQPDVTCENCNFRRLCGSAVADEG